MKFPKLHSSAAHELAADVTAKTTNCLEDKDEEATKTCMGFGETFKPHYPK